ncbi:MAG: ABC transporter ATP-binding protein [Chloroflexota bacterium]
MTAEPRTTVEIHELSFKYVGRRQPTLQGISLRVEAGESVLVLGPSGCGKSTLALCLNGSIPHAVEGNLTGSVAVGELDTRRASTAELAQRVGIVFQDPEAQFCMLTVEDEVAFGLENLAVPRADMDRRIDAALAQVGLLDRRKDRIERLSGGQKQRLALACVLALEPSVLVLDEPTAQLDPAGAAELIALLGQLRADRRHTLVIVEHRLDEVMPLVDRVVVLDATGELVADGPPREVMRRHGPSLAEAGVWTPQVSGLAFRAETDGIDLDPFPLSVPEAADALRPYAAGLQQSTVVGGDTAIGGRDESRPYKAASLYGRDSSRPLPPSRPPPPSRRHQPSPHRSFGFESSPSATHGPAGRSSETSASRSLPASWSPSSGRTALARAPSPARSPGSCPPRLARSS